MTPDRAYEFDVTGKALRALYGDISERIASGIVSGGRRFFAVFPPGTDRARIVSYVMSAVRFKTLIVSPNAARRQYWKARRAHQADLYDAAASTWTNVPGQMISTNPYSCSPVLTLTHRQLSESRTAGQEHEAVQRFATHAARQGYKLVILDECAGLPDAWREEFMAYVREADAAVIGFSSYTPDSDAAWYRHCKESVLLDVPAAVAALQGALTPYRHHVLFQRSIPADAAAAGDSDARLVQSAGKIVPALEIIESEVRQHGAEARIAVLMDAHALTHVRVPGLLDGIGVLRAMEAVPTLAASSPVMLTGASVIVPTGKQADIVPAIRREAQGHEWEMELQIRSNEEFTEIAGEGRDWNSSAYVEIVRALMRQGLAGCILCAPELLSWGVQAMPFNTVIDLTSGSTTRYVHVPEHPKEVAVKPSGATVNYWDIIALAPAGGRDWERFLEKHAATECPTGEHVIEIGPGAVDMRLPAMNPVLITESLDAWNATQLDRAQQRIDWAGVWKRTVCAGVPAASIVVVPWKEFPPAVHCEAVVRELLAEDARRYSERKVSMKLHHTLWTVGAVSAALIGFLVLSREIGIYVSGAVLLFLLVKIISKWWSVRGARPRTPSVPREEFLMRAAFAVYAAFSDSVEQDLPAAAEAVQLSVREDGASRILFAIPGAETEEICRTAFMELFAPRNPSDYILMVHAFDAGKKRLQKILNSHDIAAYYAPYYGLPVPAFFAQSRAHAEVFRASWEEYIGHAVVHSGVEGLPDVPSFKERFPASVRVAWCRP